MTLTLTRRRWLLAGSLVAGIVAASWKYGGEPATAALVQTARSPSVQRGRAPASALPRLEIEKLEIGKSQEPIADAFEPRSWIAPQANVIAPPPAPPQAPPLPYTYIGKMMEDGQIVVFLARQERNYTLHSGDKLDNAYQVDDIKPTQMLLTYLPLNQQQALPIGSAD
jgi:hypothetical protein